MATLTLGIPGFSYEDLFSPLRLRDLYQLFCEELKRADAPLEQRYHDYMRTQGEGMSPEALSQLLVDTAPHVSRFVARLFSLEAEVSTMRRATEQDLVVFRFKDEFIKRRVLKKSVVDAAAARSEGLAAFAARGVAAGKLDDERVVAAAVCALLDEEAALKTGAADNPVLVALRQELAKIEAWLVVRKPEVDKAWRSFRVVEQLPDAHHLVPLRRPSETNPELMVALHHHRARDGFKLTDRRGTKMGVLAEVDYCLYCHDRSKDSCAKGLHEKSGAVKKNALGVDLSGCPLDEKISEMHTLKRQGDSIGALALVCIDNPMMPGTGHRICNDCMKACVYQKQQPVNIPLIETSALTDVLELPWGFEIYGLLSRWNPLNARRPYALPYRGKDVLVVGMGPAGYTLCHHLLNEGFGVVGIDGLKLEPLPASLVGDQARGSVPEPVHEFSALYGELDDRLMLGFGGVSEYGITVRWDKNFLTIVYASLLRRNTFRCYGGVRFGGTLTLDDAWQLGFDHVAIAVGAGKPTVIDMENNLIRGIRQASDFLMALQLTGAYKKSSIANLQVRLPAVVIGGGLTAIDTATELLAYYVVQVEKTLDRYEKLVADFGAERVLGAFDIEEKEVLAEFLEHGRSIRQERAQAAKERRDANLQPLLDQWGGVTIAYLKRLVDAPAYRLNHEEVEKCFEEGVRIMENMAPLKAVPDAGGAVEALVFEQQRLDGDRWLSTGERIELPARTVCVAAGTSPNTIYEKEFPGTFALDKRGYFAPHTAHQQDGSWKLTPSPNGFFTSYEKSGRVVSYYGDNHPRYAGSVVKAMASAKHGYVEVARLFENQGIDDGKLAERWQAWRAFTERLDSELRATVVALHRLTPTIVEVVVRAPAAARHFHPGQFFRLQNYERNSPIVDGTRLAMEGLALTGASTDPEKGLLSLIVLEMGGSSRLCAALKPGEPVIVMGPTGTPTHIPPQETVLLAGGGLGNAVLFSIGKALRAAGSRVIYFAAYKKREDVFKMEDIEAAADMVVWSVDGGDAVEPRRNDDRAFVGNVVQAMVAYSCGQLGEPAIGLPEVSRIIAIGSDRMMRAVKEARHAILKPHFSPEHVGIASINSPMQCMMKEVCAQCLQKHVDPVTGKETVIFSCVDQDQPIDNVDFEHLSSRLRANTVQEKLTNLWLERVLAKVTRI